MKIEFMQNSKKIMTLKPLLKDIFKNLTIQHRKPMKHDKQR